MACGDDDGGGDGDDDGGGTTPDASDDGGGQPDGGVPDGGVPDGGGEPDAAPPAGPGQIWVHGVLTAGNPDQVAAYNMGTPIPATPEPALPPTGHLAIHESDDFASYSVNSLTNRVAFPAELDPKADPPQYDLYVASTDGTGTRRVVDVPAPAWVGKAKLSPNGQFIAYSVVDLPNNPAGVFRTFVAPAGATDAPMVQISPADAVGDVDDVVWTPDSTSVVMTGTFTQAGTFEMVITDITDPTPSPVPLISIEDIEATATPVGVIQPIPDGAGNVFFLGRLDADNRRKFYSVPTSGSGLAQVVPNSEILRDDGVTFANPQNAFSLSPDLTQVSFAADQRMGVFDVWVMPVDGSSAPVPVTVGVTQGAPAIQPIKWRPDGTAVAFPADYEVNGRDEPIVAPVDGTGHRRLATFANAMADAFAVAWSPDGNTLFMIAGPSQNRDLLALTPTLVDQQPVVVFNLPGGGNLRSDILVSD